LANKNLILEHASAGRKNIAYNRLKSEWKKVQRVCKIQTNVALYSSSVESALALENEVSPWN
jgi:hypothetical protein